MPLVLSRLQAGCGCTTPVADKTVLQPGESGTITVKFNPSGKSKKQDKKVTIFSNSVPKQLERNSTPIRVEFHVVVLNTKFKALCPTIGKCIVQH